jgi:DNA-binding winged helix-turn-helix (wHTH) protein
VKICFGPFTVDLDTRQLIRDDQPLRLSPKAFELLATLAIDRPRVLSKAELQQHLWPDSFVAEANLSNLIAEIRGVLGDQARAPKYLRTAHRYGYAFCGEAHTIRIGVDMASGDPPCWVEWGSQKFPLSFGEHVIGRDPGAAVRVDATTVSRRHAKIVVTSAGATIEDLDSKNGTQRDGQPVTTPVPLSNGDALLIGSALITFHLNVAGSTETQRDS